MIPDETLRIFWQDEHDNSPLWREHVHKTRSTTFEQFKAWADLCEVHTAGDNCLIVCDPNNELHFFLLRKTDVDIDKLKILRDRLIATRTHIYTWTADVNKGIVAILGELGFEWSGASKLEGHSRRRVFKWKNYVYLAC